MHCISIAHLSLKSSSDSDSSASAVGALLSKSSSRVLVFSRLLLALEATRRGLLRSGTDASAGGGVAGVSVGGPPVKTGLRLGLEAGDGVGGPEEHEAASAAATCSGDESHSSSNRRWCSARSGCEATQSDADARHSASSEPDAAAAAADAHLQNA